MDHRKDKGIYREKYIDIAKGIGVILVCMGHRHFPENLQVFIYAFHMPLFFFLSGCVFSDLNASIPFHNFLLKKIKTLILPVLYFNSFQLVLSYISKLLQGTRLIIDKEYLLHFFGVSGAVWPAAVLWFPISLFFVEIFFCVITKRWKVNIPILIIIFGVCNLIGYVIPKSLSQGFCSSFIGLIFFSLGNWIHKKEWIKYFSKIYYILAGLIVLCLCSILVLTERTSIVYLDFKNAGYSYFSSIGGIVAFVGISQRIGKCKVLEYFGKNSAVAMYIQSTLIFVFEVFDYFVFHVENEIYTSIPISIFETFAMLLLIAFASVVINNYFPFLIGKTKAKSNKF